MPTPKQLANLRPQNKRTKSEQREIAKRGGKKLGEIRRINKTFRELLMEQLSEENINRKTLKEALANKLLKLALSGNMKAIEMVRDTLGEKPKEKQEITNNTPVNINLYIKKLKKIREKMEKW